MNLTKLFSRHKWAKNHIISYMAHIIWSIFQIRLAPYLMGSMSAPRFFDEFSTILVDPSFMVRFLFFYACLKIDKIGIDFNLLFTT